MALNRPTLGFSTERMELRGMWGEPKDRAEGVRLLSEVVKAGVDLLEVVPIQGPLRIEDLVREALHPYPTGVMISIRTGITTNTAIAASIRRLAIGLEGERDRGLDLRRAGERSQLDLLVVPPRQVTSAEELVDIGLVRQIGVIATKPPTDLDPKSGPVAARMPDRVVWANGHVTPLISAPTLSGFVQALGASSPPGARPG